MGAPDRPLKRLDVVGLFEQLTQSLHPAFVIPRQANKLVGVEMVIRVKRDDDTAMVIVKPIGKGVSIRHP